jgi:hypothetical protein
VFNTVFGGSVLQADGPDVNIAELTQGVVSPKPINVRQFSKKSQQEEVVEERLIRTILTLRSIEQQNRFSCESTT